MNSEQVVFNLDRPNQRQHRWMHWTGVFGLVLSVPALLVLLGLIGAVSVGVAELAAVADVIKWTCRFVITGFLLSAIGFWDR